MRIEWNDYFILSWSLSVLYGAPGLYSVDLEPCIENRLHASRNTPDHDVVRRFSSSRLIYYRGKRKANCKHFQRCIFYVWMMAWIGRTEIEKIFLRKILNSSTKRKHRRKSILRFNKDLPQILLVSLRKQITCWWLFDWVLSTILLCLMILIEFVCRKWIRRSK